MGFVGIAIGPDPALADVLADRRPRDAQRARVYRWERGAIGAADGRRLLTLRDCESLAGEVFGDAALPAPRITDGRGRRTAGYAPGDHSIRLPRHYRSRAVVLHECAHGLMAALDPRGRWAWHGPEFVAVLSGLAALHLSIDLDRLLVSAQRAGVVVHPGMARQVVTTRARFHAIPQT
jgi:hypothetical protein